MERVGNVNEIEGIHPDRISGPFAIEGICAQLDF